MKHPRLAVSLCVVFLASCGGGSGGTTEIDTGDTADVDDNGSTASDDNVLSDGTVISSTRCVDETLSVVDAEYDVFLDAPKFDSFTRIGESLSFSEESAVEATTVSSVMASLGLAMLSAGTPAAYTTNVCNHSLYLADQCALIGSDVNASLATGVLTGTISFADTTAVDFTIDSADNGSGSILYTEAGTDNIQNFEWSRSDAGTERYSATTPTADIAFEEKADCSGSSVVTAREGGAVDSVMSATWTSPRNSDFMVTFESCRYTDNVPSCNSYTGP